MVAEMMGAIGATIGDDGGLGRGSAGADES
jgi:hypothetical protein